MHQSAEQIVQRYESGGVILSLEQVKNQLKAEGWKTYPVPERKLPRFTEQYLRAEYVDKKRTMGQIAQEHKICESSIQKWLLKYGIERRQSSAYRVKKLNEKAICREYLEGKSANDLASKYGVSVPAITRRLKQNGVEIRGKRITGRKDGIR